MNDEVSGDSALTVVAEKDWYQKLVKNWRCWDGQGCRNSHYEKAYGDAPTHQRAFIQAFKVSELRAF
ncbi:MAG TPA: hypothetical protein VG125_12345 [Pirellulales bacterium]|nr:hypothetical protein [Pirellulales bacterium]